MAFDKAKEIFLNPHCIHSIAKKEAKHELACALVDEMKPGRYMVTDKDGNVRFAMYSTKIPMWWGGANQPTAWMPLPEPYKGEE